MHARPLAKTRAPDTLQNGTRVSACLLDDAIFNSTNKFVCHLPQVCSSTWTRLPWNPFPPKGRASSHQDDSKHETEAPTMHETLSSCRDLQRQQCSGQSLMPSFISWTTVRETSSSGQLTCWKENWEEGKLEWRDQWRPKKDSTTKDWDMSNVAFMRDTASLSTWSHWIGLPNT